MIEKCERQRSTEHGYTISLPCEPNCSGELKSIDVLLCSVFIKFSEVNKNLITPYLWRYS